MNTLNETQLISPKYDTPETERVAELLEAEGFSVEPLRSSLPAPDLLVRGPIDFFAEVKAIESDAPHRAFERGRSDAERRLAKYPVGFSVHLYVSENATDGDYKMLFELIRSAPTPNGKETFVGLARNYSRDKVLQYSAATKSGIYEFVVAAADSRIIIPWHIGEPEWGSDVFVRGVGETRKLKLTNYDDAILIGARLYSGGSKVGLTMISGADGAYRSTIVHRIRRDANKANTQIELVPVFETGG